jgi:hypothetical protein
MSGEIDHEMGLGRLYAPSGHVPVVLPGYGDPRDGAVGDDGPWRVEPWRAGPGLNLTHVASRLPRQAIARTLVNPTAPMPSFKNLPAAKFKAVVEYLSLLR